MLSLTLWTRLSHPPHSLQNPSFTASPHLLQYPTLPVYTTFLPSVSLSSFYQRSPFLFFCLPLIVVPNILRAVGETHFNSLDENSFPRVEGSQTEKSSWTRLHFLRSMTDCLTSFFYLPPDKSHASQCPNKALILPAVLLLTANRNFSLTRKSNSVKLNLISKINYRWNKINATMGQ